jgi:hypothetical protein
VFATVSIAIVSIAKIDNSKLYYRLTIYTKIRIHSLILFHLDGPIVSADGNNGNLLSKIYTRLSKV